MARTRGWRPAEASAGAAYDRARDLPRLVLIWPAELADTSAAGRRRVVLLLERALRFERRRGLARSWSYDLGRHRALAIATRAEREALAEAAHIERSPTRRHGRSAAPIVTGAAGHSSRSAASRTADDRLTRS